MRVLENANAVFNNPKDDFISSIRPNPFSDYLTFVIDHKVSGSINIEIYSLTGTRVFNQNINAGKAAAMRLDLETLPIGLYFISITDGEDKYTQLISKSQ